MKVVTEVDVDVAALLGEAVARAAECALLTCPTCGPDVDVLYVEDVRRQMKMLKVNPDGRALIFDPVNDDMDYENTSDEHLECASCFAPVPLPEGWSIDFDGSGEG
jgi:hypothetical protein